jgi:type IV secretion system protein VirB4
VYISYDLIQLNYTDGNKKFAQMIEIKEYSPYTMIGILDSLMYLDVNYTMTQSFSPIARHEAKEKLKKH